MSADVLSAVKGIAEGVVKRTIPDARQNLFDGGFVDSLSAVHLLVEIEKKFNVPLDVLDFAERDQFSLQSISDLVERSRNRHQPA